MRLLPELLAAVAGFLSGEDLTVLMTVNRELRQVCLDDALWRPLYLHDCADDAASAGAVIPDKHRVGGVLPSARCCSWYTLYRRAKLGLVEVWVVSAASGTPFLVRLDNTCQSDQAAVVDAIRSAQVRHDGFAPQACPSVSACLAPLPHWSCVGGVGLWSSGCGF